MQRRKVMGKLIIFPTDTVYGIGCEIFDKENINKIYELKHRPRSKPLACLCADLKQIKQIAYINSFEKKVIEKFMPGALTIILKAKKKVAETTGFETIGVRIPNSKIAQRILIKNFKISSLENLRKRFLFLSCRYMFEFLHALLFCHPEQSEKPDVSLSLNKTMLDTTCHPER